MYKDIRLISGSVLVAEHSGNGAWQVNGEGREEGGVAAGCMVRQALREVRPASSALHQPRCFTALAAMTAGSAQCRAATVWEYVDCLA